MFSNAIHAIDLSPFFIWLYKYTLSWELTLLLLASSWENLQHSILLMILSANFPWAQIRLLRCTWVYFEFIQLMLELVCNTHMPIFNLEFFECHYLNLRDWFSKSLFFDINNYILSLGAHSLYSSTRLLSIFILTASVFNSECSWNVSVLLAGI